MKKSIVTALTAVCLATPAFAESYPVSGRYGLSTETKPGPIDCTGKRVIRFAGVQRFDSHGGVPSYRLVDTQRNGATDFRITEAFATGQITAQNKIRLQIIDSDRIELVLSPGGTLKLKRCG